MSWNTIYVFAVNHNGSGMDSKWIENRSEMDSKWIENGMETLQFNVEDDLPFPLNLSPTWK
jgi:hypothetical protein